MVKLYTSFNNRIISVGIMCNLKMEFITFGAIQGTIQASAGDSVVFVDLCVTLTLIYALYVKSM